MFAVCLEARDIPPSQTYIFDLTTEMLTLDAKLTIDVEQVLCINVNVPQDEPIVE